MNEGLLLQENIPWLALDLDPLRIAEAYVGGESTFYGDACSFDVLKKAGLSKARMIVLTFGKEETSFSDCSFY